MKQFNNTAQEIPFEPITEQIRRQAQRIPEETAVVSGEESITFAELDRISRRIAAGLRLLGIQAGAETMVGVILNRTWRVYAAELGILKAGGAYIPFAAEYPDARIHYCMEDAGSPLLITSEKLRAERPGLVGKDYRIVTIEELMAADGDAFEPASIGPDSLALAVYTSGSTGNPKGVLIEHISLVESAFPCETNPLTALFSAGQVFMPVTSMGFVAASYFDLSALCAGKTVCVPDEEERMDAEALIRCIRRNNVSEAFFSPSLIKSLWYSPAREVIFGLVESIGTGSEKIELSLVREMMAQYPKLKIFNFYGASETCVGCTCGVLCPEDEVITVGSPVTNVTVAVLSEDGKTLPPGEKGELIVCGDRLFRGYMNLPEKNKEVFFEYEGKRAFRTGDVACWTKDGRIRIFGRDDDMVKVRGHRVELPEVEDAIKSYPGIKNNKALLRSGESEEFLVAFFAAEEKISIPKLRQYLSLRLPSYMIPSLFMQLDQLPLNDNGKTDRITLQNMELRAEEQDLTAPETETEKALFSMVQSITGIHGFGTRTSILSLGITSLSAMRLSARIRETFGVFIRYSDILQEPTIEGIARMIREASEKESGAPSPAEVHEEAVPLSENQKGVYLAWELDRESTAYNLPFVYRFESGEVSPEKLEKAVNLVIKIHSGMNLRLQMRKGEVFQAAGAAAPEPIPVIAALHTPDQAYYRSRIRPFDLFEGPLYRFEIHVSKEYTDLFMDIHHIIFDGISSTIFERDLNAALRGETPEPEICSASRWYAAAQKSTPEEVSGYFEALVSQAECASYPASLQPDGCGLGTVSRRIPAAAVQQFCREHEITPSSFFHGAFAEALRRITANDNPFYLTVSSGRGDSWELSNTTGFFVKTLPVVLPSSEGSQTVVSYAREVHDRMQEILRRDSYTYTTLAETQQLRGEILFAYQGEIRQPDTFVSGRAAALAPKDPQFPIFAEVYPEGDSYVFMISYDGNLYSRRDMEGFAGACAAGALSMAQCDWIRQVRLVSREEEAELKALSRGKELSYDRTMTWVDHFLLHAEAHPDRTAVTDRFGSFTYGQLLALGWRVAAYLEGRGVSEGDFVAVKMGRVKEFSAAVLGIHLAGAAYVPVDPEYPKERIRYILEDCEAKVLLTEEELKEISDNDPVCCQAAAKAAPEQVAYMIYTSGSTGRPKGVMIQHRAMMNFLQFTADSFHITEE
ncbi:MAG: AMP-binding protein, partial [Anaerovoracaceae bacterium]